MTFHVSLSTVSIHVVTEFCIAVIFSSFEFYLCEAILSLVKEWSYLPLNDGL